jgi:hypothetical protein
MPSAHERLSGPALIIHPMADRSERKWPQRVLPSREQLAHAPQIVTVSVVSLGFVTYAIAPAPCERPCAVPNGGGAAILPAEFGIDSVPTKTHQPIRAPIVARGSATLNH